MYKLDENSKYSVSIPAGICEGSGEGGLLILARKSDSHIIVKLLSISKLKAIYDLPFKNFSSNNKFMTVLANSDSETFSSPVLEKFMRIFAMKNVFKSLSIF